MKYAMITLSLLFAFALHSQCQSEEFAMGILPISHLKKTEQSDAIEFRLMEKVNGQKRFKVLDEREGKYVGLNFQTEDLAKKEEITGATHLVQFTIHPLIHQQKPPQIKDFKQDVNLNIESQLQIEIQVFDVSTAEIVVNETLQGSSTISEKISAISPTKVAWSKEKGMHSVKKTEKEMTKEHAEKMKKVAELALKSLNQAIDQAVVKTNKKFIRLFVPEISIVEMTESKKGKAKMVRLNTGEQLGLTSRERIDVLLISELEFMGEKQTRETDIGTLKFEELKEGKPHCKVGSGKEAIFEAMEKGQKLICKIKEP